MGLQLGTGVGCVGLLVGLHVGASVVGAEVGSVVGAEVGAEVVCETAVGEIKARKTNNRRNTDAIDAAPPIWLF